MKTLTGYKIEKILVAVIEKNRSGTPWNIYGSDYFIRRIKDELKELIETLEDIESPEYYENAMKEVADISNFCDYLAELLIKEYIKSRE